MNWTRPESSARDYRIILMDNGAWDAWHLGEKLCEGAELKTAREICERHADNLRADKMIEETKAVK